MGLWKSILRSLGLSNDARVRISTPDIEVTLSGDPEKVRLLLGVVRHELEMNPRLLVRSTPSPKRRRGIPVVSQVVQPTELDEMDSPYALPEAVVLPVAMAMPEGSRLTGWGDRAAAFIDDAKLAVVERLIEWCAGRDHTLLDLALSWHTSHPLVASVIAGATTPEQVAANVAAAQWALTPADRAEVDAILAVP